MLPVRFVGSLLFASTIARIWKGDLEIEQVISEGKGMGTGWQIGWWWFERGVQEELGGVCVGWGPEVGGCLFVMCNFVDSQCRLGRRMA